MKIKLSLPNFSPDTDVCAVVFASDINERVIGSVTFNFEGDDIISFTNLTLNTEDRLHLAHYLQANIIKSASDMLDSFFDDDSDAITSLNIDA